jgi:hypothetical protein
MAIMRHEPCGIVNGLFLGQKEGSVTIKIQNQGHSAKNDLSMEVLRAFCTRETFLRSVPETRILCLIFLSHMSIPGAT